MADEYAAPFVVDDMAVAAAPYYPPNDILDVAEPTAQRKAEMRMATMPPSEWLRLLCRDWSLENESVVMAADVRFYHYKSYLKGQLTSQLLCRLSISGSESSVYEAPAPPVASAIDFWKILGVEDEFDRAHIVANIERFCSLYNIRGGTLDELPPSPTDMGMGGVGMPQDSNNVAAAVIGNNFFPDALHDPATAAAAAAAASIGTENCALLFPVDPIAAAHAATKQPHYHHPHHHPNDVPTKITTRQTNEAKAYQRRLKAETREREREAYSIRKAAEKAARLAGREERRQHKLAMRKRREEIAQAQKEAALRRAAELVQSNRVPIEITRGAVAAQAAANAAVANAAIPAAEAVPYCAVPAPDLRFMAAPPAMVATATVPATTPARRGRSSIVISTASDLDQIVTHSNNLWTKYNAIAKEHNQKVNWIVVAKELGIHVKVREKYARMHARAKARGFDFVSWGGYRIKDYPQYFLDPLGPNIAPMSGPESALPARIEEPGKVQAFAVSVPPLPQQQMHEQNPLMHVAEAMLVAGRDYANSGPAVVAPAEAALGKGLATAASMPQQALQQLPGSVHVAEATLVAAEANYANNVPVVAVCTGGSSVVSVPALPQQMQQQPLGHGSVSPNPHIHEANGTLVAAEANYANDGPVVEAVVVSHQPTEVSGDEARVNVECRT